MFSSPAIAFQKGYADPGKKYVLVICFTSENLFSKQYCTNFLPIPQREEKTPMFFTIPSPQLSKIENFRKPIT